MSRRGKWDYMSMCAEYTAKGRWEGRGQLLKREDRKKHHIQQSQPDEGASIQAISKTNVQLFLMLYFIRPAYKGVVFFYFFYRYYPSNNTMEEYKCIDLINKIVKIRNFSLGIILHCQAIFFQILNIFTFTQYFSHLRQVFLSSRG